MRTSSFLTFSIAFAGIIFLADVNAQPLRKSGLTFDSLAKRWDDAMFLGNGMMGALVWERAGHLRISLDRADLWDERPALQLNKLSYKWVQHQVQSGQYDTVQKIGDDPYEVSPFPTKLPAGALEFDIKNFGAVVSNRLDISRALNTISFKSGVICNIYVHAKKQCGYFGFDHLPDNGFDPILITPAYHDGTNGSAGNSVDGLGLQRLGYATPIVRRSSNKIIYHQVTSNGHFYEIFVQWKYVSPNHVIGGWTITSDRPAEEKFLLKAIGEPTGWKEHEQWWKAFWEMSAVSIPDTLLQKQYDLELYKLGCVARKGAPAITLQAVWTADNGNLPPWKGDFHNDLNTQLSYWPAYTSNHLDEASTFTDWLWNIRQKNLGYTRQYFNVTGLAVPGVATLHGAPMGGWIQYSLSPTVGAWAAQHFYWQWKYSMDDIFLRNRAYPYIHDVASFLENITYLKDGKRYLPLGSSPEYNDNSISAWFSNWTNYDLSLVKFLFSAAAEVSAAAGHSAESTKWTAIGRQLPQLSVNDKGLQLAKGYDFEHSHRHLSPFMAIYPLALLDPQNSNDSAIITNSLKHLEKLGTMEWCGYSFSWMASMYAYTGNADSALNMLRLFADRFCGMNSFHLNGDQKGGEYSHFTYRPFTLEGNFAFAQGLQEMLLQSEHGRIQIFPATPSQWKDVSFSKLRAMGAFIVSAKKINGEIATISIYAEKGGRLQLVLPSERLIFSGVAAKEKISKGVLTVRMKKGETFLVEEKG